MEWKTDDIKALRKKLSLSQREFAKKLGVSRNLIFYWESGKKKPSADSLRRLAELAKTVSKNEAVSKSVGQNEVSVSNSPEAVSKNGDAVSKNVSREDTKRDTKSENVSREDTKQDTKNVTDENVNSENVNSESVSNQKTDNPDNPSVSKPKGDNQFKKSYSKYDPAYIVSVLELLGHREAGGVTEVRIFPNDRYMIINRRREYVGATVSGYYDDYAKLADDIAPFDGKANIYITINPVIKDLLARAHNRLQYTAKTTTSDENILCDLWFPIDIDPIRPADISSTDDELLLSIARRDEIVTFLSPWAQTIKGMSGSGGHSLIHLPGYPNNAETRQKKESLTKYLHDHFTDWELDAQGNPILDDKGAKIKRKDGVDVDNTVFNMSRIWKLYGTMAVKGDNVPDRPHRRSYLEIPDVIPEPVDLYALLDEIIPQESTQEKEPNTVQRSRAIARDKDFNDRRQEPFRKGDYPFLDVPAYLDASGVTWRTKEKGNRTWYQFETCPIHTDDDGHKWECGICQDADGKMGAKCMHDTEYTWQDFKEVLGDPNPYYSKTGAKGERAKRNDSDLKSQIATIRRRKKKKAFEIKQEMSELIISDMKGQGRFYQTKEKLCYYFDEKRKGLHLIGDDRSLGAQIEDKYGLNPSEQEYTFLIEAMITEAYISGEQTIVHQFAFYDTDANILYVYNNDNGIHRLDGQEIQLVDNGTDGVLFLGDPLFEPFEYVDIGNQNFVEQLITKPINFSNGDGVNLNKSEQQWLFTLDIFTKFFDPLLPTKPIVAFIGPKGSGKTMAQRILLKVLFGSGFDVTSVTKEDDFDAAVTANYIVAFDNVDGKIDWLNDKLAHTATGKMIQKRELYTTNRNIRFFPKCFLMLNARTPQFKREDVTDRLLLFRTETLDQKRSEAEIITEVMKCRVEIWSELLNNLNTIVSAFASEPTNFTTAFRIADWAKTAWRIAEIRGQGEEFLDLLNKMDKAQSEFLLEDNPIFLCLSAWLAKPENVGREVMSSTLYNDFQIIAVTLGISFTYKNATSFGIRLRNILDDLREFFEVRAEKYNNRWMYVFNLKG